MAVFHRRRRATEGRGEGPAPGAGLSPAGDNEFDLAGDNEFDLAGDGGWVDADSGLAATGRAAGPWDAADDPPPGERIDFGSLQVPVREGLDIQVNISEEDHGAWISVLRGESALQVQAFAAPKSGGLWDDVRQEIAAEVAKAGGESEAANGPFGPELRALLPEEGAGGGRPGARSPVRFLGVDGPRWFLRGVISGVAARDEQAARPLEEAFADVVVARGDHPVPPRDLLEIRLPEEAQQALQEEMEAAGEGGLPLSPFERGPEITETR